VWLLSPAEGLPQIEEDGEAPRPRYTPTADDGGDQRLACCKIQDSSFHIPFVSIELQSRAQGSASTVNK